MPKNTARGRRNRNNRNNRATNNPRNTRFSATRNGELWINRAPMSTHQFLPRRVMTTLSTFVNGNYLTGTAQQSGCMQINASSFFEPFALAVNPIGSTGSNTSNITVGAGSSVNQNPLGYSELSNLYAVYKVFWAALRIQVTPTNVADVVLCSASPSAEEASGITTNLNQIAGAPWGQTITSTNGARNRVINIRVTGAQILGMNDEQFRGIGPTLMGAGPGSNQQWFFNISWQNVLAQNPAGNINFQFKLDQFVEVSNVDLFSV